MILIFWFCCLAECDNCAQTLLKDLENLDEELQSIKSQLGNATASASAQERVKNLEKALLDTKVNCQGPANLSCNYDRFKIRSKGRKETNNACCILCWTLHTFCLLEQYTFTGRRGHSMHGCACSNTRDPSLIRNLSEFCSKAHVSTQVRGQATGHNCPRPKVCIHVPRLFLLFRSFFWLVAVVPF